MSEQILIRKAQAGDAEAFHMLVEKYSSVIWSVVNRMLSSDTTVEDLFQESVIRFWKGLPSFQGDSKLSTWLYKVTYRVCLDHIEAEKRHGRQDSLDAKLEETGTDFADEYSGGQKVENRLAAKESIKWALEKLDPEWRAMLTLYYWKGMSVEEISEISDRPVSTVKVYLHRARARLRKVLEVGGYPGGL